MIAVQHLSKRFGNRKILKNVSFSLPDKGLYLLKGPNGSGKSTLLSILSGRDSEYEGSLIVEGRLIDSKNREHYADWLVSYCPQDPLIFDDLNCLDNVLTAFGKKDQRRARDVLSAVGLDNAILTKAASLSSGEKQRLAVARTLYSSRPIVILDEPTSLLDADNARVLATALSGYANDHLVIVSSNEEWPEEAKGVLLINDGTLSLQPPDSLDVNLPRATDQADPVRRKRLFTLKEHPKFFSVLAIVSVVLFGFGSFAGGLATSASSTLFAPFDELDRSYSNLALAEHGDLLPSAYGVQFEGEPLALIGTSSFSCSMDYSIQPSLLSVVDTTTLPDYFAEYANRLTFVFGAMPAQDQEIALPLGAYEKLCDKARIADSRSAESFLRLQGQTYYEVEGYRFKISGVFNAPIYPYTEAFYESICQEESFVKIFDYLSAATFCSTSGLIYRENFDPTDLNQQIGSITAAYPATEANRLKAKDANLYLSIGTDFPLTKKDGSQAAYWPSGTLFRTACFVFLSAGAALSLVMALVYCFANGRRYLLLRVAGSSGRALRKDNALAFVLVFALSSIVGMLLGLGGCYVYQALFLSSLVGYQTPFITYDPFIFVLGLVLMVLGLGISLLLGYRLLFKKDLTRELYRLKAKR